MELMPDEEMPNLMPTQAMKSARSGRRSWTGCVWIAIGMVYSGICFVALYEHCKNVIQERHAICLLQRHDPQRLSEACRTLIANRSHIHGAPDMFQVNDTNSVWLNRSLGKTWPDVVPDVIVRLRPMTLEIRDKSVIVELTRGPRAVRLWVFSDGNVGRGSICLMDGVWIARKKDNWGTDRRNGAE